MSIYSKEIGIDLGTANTLIYLKGKGIILREPSVVAVNNRTGQVLAVGDEAKQMIGRTPGNITAIRPLEDGVIADYETTQRMLKYFISKAVGKRPIVKPRIVICVPSGVTEVEKRAVMEAALMAGAKKAFLIEEPMASAIGAGLPVEEPSGSMIVDIGGGTSEVAVVSLGGIVVSRSLRIAGDEFDDAIIRHMKRQHNIMIGERTAEDVKLKIGMAYPMEKEETYTVSGRNLITGLPTEKVISSIEITEALREPINAVVDSIKHTLEKTPPELASDIMETGIMLAGGGGQLRGLDRLITEETGIHTYVSEHALDCVALGAGKVLEEINVLSRVLYS